MQFLAITFEILLTSIFFSIYKLSFINILNNINLSLKNIRIFLVNIDGYRKALFASFFLPSS